MKRIFVKRRIRNIQKRNVLVQKPNHPAHHPALALAFLTQEQHVVVGQQRNVDLRDDGVLISHDAGIKIFAGCQHANKIVLNFLFDRFGFPPAVDQFFEIRGASLQGGCLFHG